MTTTNSMGSSRSFLFFFAVEWFRLLLMLLLGQSLLAISLTTHSLVESRSEWSESASRPWMGVGEGVGGRSTSESRPKRTTSDQAQKGLSLNHAQKDLRLSHVQKGLRLSRFQKDLRVSEVRKDRRLSHVQ